MLFFRSERRLEDELILIDSTREMCLLGIAASLLLYVPIELRDDGSKLRSVLLDSETTDSSSTSFMLPEAIHYNSARLAPS